MKHKDCGGDLMYDTDRAYEYEGQRIPSLWCWKCGEEITGDPMIEFEDEDDSQADGFKDVTEGSD